MKNGVDKREKKLFVYSGHDTTINAFLALLKLNDGQWPQYASNIVLELYEQVDENEPSKKTYFVHTLYNSKQMILPECSLYCPWTQFESLVQYLFHPQHHTECSKE